MRSAFLELRARGGSPIISDEHPPAIDCADSQGYSPLQRRYPFKYLSDEDFNANLLGGQPLRQPRERSVVIVSRDIRRDS